MRKMMLLAVMVAMAALMMAASPAMADDNDRDGFDDMTFRFVDDDFCDFFGCEDDFDRFDFNDGFGDFEQEAESGDVDQSFDVSQTGDNSNQTAGIQGVANTGNAQNQIGVIDAGGFGDLDANDDDERFFFVDDNNDDDGIFFGDDFDNDRFFGDNDGDFEFDEVGSTIEVSPTNTTSSDQQVNQTASAFGS